MGGRPASVRGIGSRALRWPERICSPCSIGHGERCVGLNAHAARWVIWGTTAGHGARAGFSNDTLGDVMITRGWITAILLLAVVLAGCGIGTGVVREEKLPEPITAFKDPDFATVRFRRVAVLVDTADLQWRATLERAIVAETRGRRMDAIPSTGVLFPTRVLTEAERRDVLAKSGVDAYLRLTVENVVVNERQVPLTSTTTTKRERNPANGAPDSTGKSAETETVTQTTQGGYTEKTVIVRYGVSLIDVASGRTTWMAVHTLADFTESGAARFGSQLSGQFVRDSVLVRSPVVAAR